MKKSLNSFRNILLAILTLLLALTGALAMFLLPRESRTADAYSGKAPTHPYWNLPIFFDSKSVIAEGEEGLAPLLEYWSNPIDTNETIMYLSTGSGSVNYNYCFDGELNKEASTGAIMAVPCITNTKTKEKFVIVTYGSSNTSEYSILKSTGAYIMDSHAITDGYINFSMPSTKYPADDGSIFTGLHLYANPNFYIDGDGNYFVVVLSAMKTQIYYDYKTGYCVGKVPVVGIAYLGQKGIYKSKEECKAQGDNLLELKTTKSIEVPTPKEDLVYNGEKQYAFDQNPEGYTVTGDGNINAGSYEATLTLKDGYCWQDNSTDTKTVKFTIARQPIEVPEPSSDLTYTNFEKQPFYSTAQYTVSGDYRKKFAGDYVAIVTPTANYCWKDYPEDTATGPVEVKWSIKKATINFSMGEAPSEIKLKKGTGKTYSISLNSSSALMSTYTGHVEFKVEEGSEYCKLYVPENPEDPNADHSMCHKITLYNITNKAVVTVKVRCELTEDDNFYAVRGDKACVWTIHILQAGGFYIGDAEGGIDSLETQMYYSFAEALEAYAKLTDEEKANSYIHASKEAVIDEAVTIDSPVKVIGDEGSTIYFKNSGDSANPAAINVEDGGALTFDNVKITDERTNPANSVVKIAGGEVEITNSEFTNCKADDGGAIYMESGALTVNSGTFTGNTATGNGGAIYVKSNATATFKGDIIFANNSAMKDGGAIYIESDSKVIMPENSYFDSNTCYGNGGAIYIRGGSLEISGAYMFANTAKGNGGAIYVDKCAVEFLYSSISYSKAQYGGGIYIAEESSVNLQGGFIENNAALTGGGIYICDRAKAVVDNFCIQKNMATGDENTNGTGGGIFVAHKGRIRLKNNIFLYDNKGFDPDLGSVVNNLFLSAEKTLTIDYDISNSVIGVSANINGDMFVLCEGLGQFVDFPQTYLIPDDSAYCISVDSDSLFLAKN